jgi:hypothetical protein
MSPSASLRLWRWIVETSYTDSTVHPTEADASAQSQRSRNLKRAQTTHRPRRGIRGMVNAGASRVLSNAITKRGRGTPTGNRAARKLRVRAHVSRAAPDCVPRIAVLSEQLPANARFSAARPVRRRALARRLVVETCGGRQRQRIICSTYGQCGAQRSQMPA